MGERVVKATQFIQKCQDGSQASRQYYVVFETEHGHKISTERLKDGAVTWVEDPEDVEQRNSLAKVLQVADCERAGITVQDVMTCQVKENQRRSGHVNLLSKGKNRSKQYSVSCMGACGAAEKTLKFDECAWNVSRQMMDTTKETKYWLAK